jgi:hypothetical protein
MKFIPDAIGRKIASTGLLANENAPKILFIGGVVGMVGSTVLACRATLKLEDVLDEVEGNIQKEEQVKAYVASGQAKEGTTYPDKEYKRKLLSIQVRGAGSVAKLYAPSVIVGGVSILALTKSHNILQDRNLALTAAYAAVDGAFNRYRERVIDRYGEDVDNELRYDSEEVSIVDPESGEVLSTTRVTDAPGSPYKRFYDEDTTRCWSPDPQVNIFYLRSVQNWANDRLHARGHLFLNEVFTELGLAHTKAGAIVGWRFNKGSGDDTVDFGIWDGREEVVNDFFAGREGAILLDFNVDGVIYDKLDSAETVIG